MKGVKVKKLHGQVKRIIEPLDKVEVDAYAAHFYDFLTIHQKYLKDGSYDKLRQIFREMKEGRIKNAEGDKKLGDYGISLISLILYSEADDLKLIENIIALQKLLDYMENKLE